MSDTERFVANLEERGHRFSVQRWSDANGVRKIREATNDGG